MKKHSKTIDGTPNKRMFWSIISDYNLKTSICELVDNALDIWLKNKKGRALAVDIVLNTDNKTIKITDNAGGIKEQDLGVLISPGSSLNSPDENVIGLFGVGSKRAVVALAENIKIKTRHRKRTTFQIDIEEDWLESEDWEMPIYDIPNITENTTIVELNSLRVPMLDEDVLELSKHLCETYSQFISEDNFSIKLNGVLLLPIQFDNWAYPPSYEPRYYLFEIPIENGQKVGVELYAGLILDRDPILENYGVYFYCNNRLIMKEVKNREVGYISKLAGIPHPDASLARVIVKISGPAKLMPWNSSKSEINFSSPIFKGLINVLLPIVTDFSSLSRRLKGEWDEKVFSHKDGEMQYLDIDDPKEVRKSFLPPLPRVRKTAIDHLRLKNTALVKDSPWIIGALDSLAAQEIISRQRLETKNRVALIILDSTFEISLKEYIVHTDGLNRKGKSLEELFKNRDEVISVVQQKIKFKTKTLARIKHYYQMRCKLIHERATIDVIDSDIENFRNAVEECLKALFGVKI